METVLIDTSVLIGLARGQHEARDAMERVQGMQTVICDVVLAELIAGARNAEEASKWYQHLRTRYHVLPFTMEVSGHFRELLKTAWRHRGTHLSDHLIAATALAHGCSLLTLNKKDVSHISGLHLS